MRVKRRLLQPKRFIYSALWSPRFYVLVHFVLKLFDSFIFPTRSAVFFSSPFPYSVHTYPMSVLESHVYKFFKRKHTQYTKVVQWEVLKKWNTIKEQPASYHHHQSTCKASEPTQGNKYRPRTFTGKWRAFLWENSAHWETAGKASGQVYCLACLSAPGRIRNTLWNLFPSLNIFSSAVSILHSPATYTTMAVV